VQKIFSLFWCSRDGWIVHFLGWLVGLLGTSLFICSYEVVVLDKICNSSFLSVCNRSVLLISIKFMYLMHSWFRCPVNYISKDVMSMKMLIHCAYMGRKRQVGATVLYVIFVDRYNFKGACSLNFKISLL
jgi:hypothetical protein